MVNKVNDNHPSGYGTVKHTASSGNGEKFSLPGNEETQEEQKTAEKEPAKSKNSGAMETERGGVRLELSGSGKRAAKKAEE